MKKKFLLTFILIVFGVLVFGAFSASAETYGNIRYEISNDEITITGISTSVAELEIPSQINGIPVTSIDEMAFWGSGLKSVSIPGSIETIGSLAFSECRSLQTVSIGEGVSYIGTYAFAECSKLEEINIPSNVATIENATFAWCKSLKNITISNSVISIAENAFVHCDSLQNVYYGGNENQWDNITISSGNTVLDSATIHYSIYVNFVAEDGRIISSVPCIRNTSINALELPNKDGYISHFYTDYEMTNKFNTNTVISQDTNIYVKYTPKQYKYYFLDEDGSVLKEATVEYGSVIVPPLNPSKPSSTPFIYKFDSWNGYSDGMTQPSSDVYFYAKYSNSIAMDSNGAMITGAKAVTIGDDNINYKVFLETKMDDILYSTLYIKYPSEFMLNKIEAVGFEIADVESTITGEDYNISKVVAIYSNLGVALPKETLIEAFELFFSVSKDMLPGNETIEITTDSVIMSSKVDYNFDGLYGTSFDILPKLAEGISIVGDEIIENKTKYSVVFSPDYTTNKNVEWVVSDPDVALIEQDGTLTPISNGTVTLTAQTLDGSNLKATKNITIYAKAKINTITTNVGDWDIPFDSDNRKYTIYVPFDTETIDIITLFDIGTLKINGELTFNGRVKTVTLPEVATTITMVRRGVENCIDSAYVLNVVKTKPFVKTLISDNKNTFYSRAYCLGSDNTMYFALYDDNKLVSMQTDSVSEGKTTSFTADIPHDDVKIMVWNDKLAPQTDVTKYNYEGLSMLGDGTESSPYLISNIDQLKSIKNNLNAHYSLINDITFAENDKWTPLGTSEQYFTGTFDGNFHKIKGLNIILDNSATVSYAGLFAFNSGTIKNVVFEDVLFKCTLGNSSENLYPKYYAGAIAAVNSGNIYACTVSGEIYADTDCYHSISTYCCPSIYAGGIVSRNFSNGVISECSSNITITAKAYCDAMSPRASNAYVGGIVADNTGLIVNCINSGNITGYGVGAYKDVSVGGICGYSSGLDGGAVAVIDSCVNVGEVKSNDESGGIVGHTRLNETKNCYRLDTVVEGNLIYGGSTLFNYEERCDSSVFANLDFDRCWIIGKDGPSLSIQ